MRYAALFKMELGAMRWKIVLWNYCITVPNWIVNKQTKLQEPNDKYKYHSK